jgi:hypothetical protein
MEKGSKREERNQGRRTEAREIRRVQVEKKKSKRRVQAGKGRKSREKKGSLDRRKEAR